MKDGTISRYRIIERIVTGGKGKAYAAEDLHYRRNVTLKFLPDEFASEETVKTQFIQGVRAAAKLKHPCISRVYEVCEDRPLPFCVIEELSGRPLADLLEAEQLSTEQAVNLAVQLCDALAAAHREGIIHGQLDPHCIFVDDAGRLRVMDFGFPATAEPAESSAGSAAEYRSPQQQRGHPPDEGADIFAAGAVLREMLTAQRSLGEETAADPGRLTLNDPPSRTAPSDVKISQSLRRIIDRALNKQECSPYLSSADMLSDLREELKGLQTSAVDTSCFAMSSEVLSCSWAAVCILDADFKVVWVNQVWQQFFGLRREEALGQDVRQLLAAHIKQMLTDSDGVADRLLANYDNNSYTERFECHVLPAPGRERRWLEHRSQPLREGLWAGGRIEYYTDITDRKRAEERFHLLSSVAEQSSEGVALTDLNGNLQFVNRTYASRHGYEPEELLGKNLAIFHTDEQMPLVEEANRQIRQTGEFHGEVWHVHRDGTEFPTFMRNSLLRDEDGHPVGMIGTMHDISDLKKAESALRESEQKYRELYENLPDGSAAVDMAGRITQSNTAFHKMLGYSPKELAKLTYEDITPAKWHPIEAKILTHQVLTRGFSDLYEKEYIHKNGTIFPVELRTYLIKDAGGNPTGMWAVVRDITQRKQAEQALREAEHDREVILDSVSELVSYQDRSLRIKWANRAAAESVGLTAEDMRGRYCYEAWNWRDKPCPGCPVEKAIETGRVQEGEMNTPDGRIWLIRGYPVRSDDGEVTGVVEVSLEITERKQAERALHESEEKYRSLFQRSNDAIFVHDLKGNILDVNERVLEWFGYSREEMLELNIAKLHPPDALETSRWAFESISRQGHVSFETEFLRKSKERFPAEVSSSIFEIGGNEVIQGLVRDISERKAAEHELHIKESALKSAINAISITDMDGRIVYVNDAFASMWGCPDKDHVLGRHLVDFWRGYRLPETLAQLMDEGGTIEEDVATRVDGSSFNIQYSVSMIKDEEGNPAYVFGSFVDTTARKVAENMLRETSARLKTEQEELTRKNIALKQVLEHIEAERQSYKQRICQDVEQAVDPVLQKIADTAPDSRVKEVEALRTTLRAVLEKDVDVFHKSYSRLTPREVEICRLIEAGASSKQISHEFNLSVATVHKHREQIRRKLGITNKSVNLTTYLKSHKIGSM